jgi:hypothetical protein
MTAKHHFLQAVTRNDDGHFSVSLPWTNPSKEIPKNKQIAEARLKTATNKLNQQKEYERYDNIFKAWLEENIIEEVPKPEQNKAAHNTSHNHSVACIRRLMQSRALAISQR